MDILTAEDEEAEAQAEWEIARAAELLELRLRTAVGQGNAVVDVCNAGLQDSDCRVLVQLLMEAEDGAQSRLKVARSAQALADKARAENQHDDFEAFVPEPEPDEAEIAFQAASEEGNLFALEEQQQASDQPTAGDDEDERPLSYRFTPREERSDNELGSKFARVGRHASGRARILFRNAMNRHTLRQKALMAAAATAAVEYEEGGRGCTQLMLKSNDIGSRGVAQICTFVRHSSGLEVLALGRNPIGDTGAALIGRALQHTRVLKSLALQDCQIGPRGMRHLASGVARNRSLRELWLYSNLAADEGVAHVAGALRTSRVESLGLESNRVTAKGCETLALVLALPTCCLTWLRLQHNALGDAGVAAIAHALHDNTSLTHLQLRDVHAGSKGVAALAEALALGHPSLTRLGLEENRLPSDASEKLLRAVPQSKLNQLSLDLDHGGHYDRTQTRDELNRRLALAALTRGGAKSKQSRAGAEADRQARSYVGPLGVTSTFGRTL